LESLGYDAYVASNDRSKSYNGNSFSFMSPDKFPNIACDKETANTIKLIDVLWFEKIQTMSFVLLKWRKAQVYIQEF
jgi:type II restriction enzyme